VFSPFFLHCFCSFSVSPPFSFLFFCSFFLWVLLFFSVPLLSIVSSCFRPFSFSVFALFLSAHPLTFCFYVRCFLWVLLFFFLSLFSLHCFFVFSPFFLLCFCSSFASPPSSFLCSVPSLAFIAKECHAFSLTMKTFKTVITGVMVMVGDGRGICCFSIEWKRWTTSGNGIVLCQWSFVFLPLKFCN